ncbi:hypothetical protein AYO21_04206 [Fonsecaea monophora]|uniref:Major facilitator superfamily (MFS) profile domain-containing protein n=2 Tax=Fonsecaea TaxID=40354 RepID=A0A0D2DW95_9EURO|nr:uncharacterized protein Z517_05088 [Fonsecaea pedrosoi CBS 271.37]XP_022513456.1 hypothetical protein AYO21_04206 [Fonsecaea monophora]KAH0834351.1 sugar transporter [Fonsecaea pedrosoi]KIW82061.1 hypothetical protein Z517_05088 [Fonsecaea pedrosoi CBS 271.37]OAG41504.1 hypothetical protein AYO21_04206 [Fonsecaea monophora]
MSDTKATDSFDNRRSTDHEKSSGPERRRSSIADLNRNKNLDAKISNPLADIPQEELLANVEEFANRAGMTSEVELIKKGALVAQNPGQFESLSFLTEDEKDALRIEVSRKWKHPMKLYMTVIVCSIGAAVQGWDQTGTNGANLSFPEAFGLDTPEGQPGYERDFWIIGLVNSAPYIGSAFLGCWLSDPCNYYFGRRGTIFTSAIFLIATPIGGAFCQTWEQLLATRVLMGIGMGLKGATTPVFAAENSPAAIRGALVMTWQFWTAFGIFLGTAFNLAVWKAGDIGWRLQLGSAFIPAIPLAILVFLCPESPRWYIKHDKIAKAYQSLLKLRNHPLLAARDLYYISTQIDIEHDIVGDSTYISRFMQLFTMPRVRRATLASFTVMIAQQMCGINIMAFYSSTIFREGGASDFEALLGSFGFGAVNFLFAIPAFLTIDTFGRRALLLFTFPNMAWTLLAGGFAFYIPKSSSAHLGVIALFVYLFAAFYSPGEGPVPFTYSAEVFPLSHREVGMGWAVATCLFWAAVLGLTFPKILAAFTPTGAFGFFAGLNILALIMIFFWVPETKQRTLEELDYIFAVPTRRFMSYQTGTWLPWFIKRYIFWQKSAELKPLYTLDRGIVRDISEQRREMHEHEEAERRASVTREEIKTV